MRISYKRQMSLSRLAWQSLPAAIPKRRPTPTLSNPFVTMEHGRTNKTLKILSPPQILSNNPEPRGTVGTEMQRANMIGFLAKASSTRRSRSSREPHPATVSLSVARATTRGLLLNDNSSVVYRLALRTRSLDFFPERNQMKPSKTTTSI